MGKELAKMLMAKSESGESQSLKDIWAAYRKMEVQVEVMINQSLTEPEATPEPITKEVAVEPAPEITKASTEVEKIGDRIVKVQFTEFSGKRKKVTHIEVKEAKLDEMLKQNKPGGAQFEMF